MMRKFHYAPASVRGKPKEKHEKRFGEGFEMGGTWSNLKTSSGTADVENTFYATKHSNPELVNTTAPNTAVQDVAGALFLIEGLLNRQLMPYSHETFTLWMICNHQSANDGLDELGTGQHDKDLFDAMISSLGAVPGRESGFIEVLCWYALGVHSMAGTFELVGIYKLGGC
ncbi:lysyl oxidase-like protein 2/3/4 [Colletotrichum orchidophilum]|uniref:Lysyl oxidase-like protein 2/3/4 n=1 Tax=Colletotrichum orchidophilum TaxID=1209926 RepID=A0A1G4B484_9PEZI|nr:lysyl oxidase-like protein 2/3/4 [Colletotrichum orchidophilum]OHE96133.1 lysyl oxidase-like protein 2/3/4 [Colletotrichum orchidophilum]